MLRLAEVEDETMRKCSMSNSLHDIHMNWNTITHVSTVLAPIHITRARSRHNRVTQQWKFLSLRWLSCLHHHQLCNQTSWDNDGEHSQYTADCHARLLIWYALLPLYCQILFYVYSCLEYFSYRYQSDIILFAVRICISWVYFCQNGFTKVDLFEHLIYYQGVYLQFRSAQIKLK